MCITACPPWLQPRACPQRPEPVVQLATCNPQPGQPWQTRAVALAQRAAKLVERNQTSDKRPPLPRVVVGRRHTRWPRRDCPRSRAAPRTPPWRSGATDALVVRLARRRWPRAVLTACPACARGAPPPRTRRHSGIACCWAFRSTSSGLCLVLQFLTATDSHERIRTW